MLDIIRDAAAGQILRFITRDKWPQYPEERTDFQLPAWYATPKLAHLLQAQPASINYSSERDEHFVPPLAVPVSQLHQWASNFHHELSGVFATPRLPSGLDSGTTVASYTTSGPYNPYTPSSYEMSMETIPKPTNDSSAPLTAGHNVPLGEYYAAVVSTSPRPEITLVEWYADNDPDNPQNWSQLKKGIVTAQICFYTLAFYMGAPIFTASYGGIMDRFGVDLQTAALGLSMYVLAYGIGPMIWSPLSEVPVLGRNPLYIVTFGIFVLLLLPTALIDNFAGLVVLRFFQGLFGSPCIATGGATLGDMYSLLKLPYVFCLWALASTSGPALGPIVSGFSVAAEGWRWSLWEMLWLSGPIWLFMFFMMPETSSANILLRRARRLRKLTGNPHLRAQSEIDQANLYLKDVMIKALWRPNQMMFLDPSIGFTAFYTALIYGIFYSFFEAFPLVYEGMHGFNMGEQGLTFLSITVAVIIAIIGYYSFNYWYVEPEIKAHGLGPPERRLIPALVAAVCCPVGLFIFAWTAKPTIHWIAPCIGVAIFCIGFFLILQCLFLYLALSYPKYAASLFAGNDFTRSTLAAGTIHFAQPLYDNLGVARGVTLLAGICTGCVFGVFALWYWGDRLRARSKFTDD